MATGRTFAATASAQHLAVATSAAGAHLAAKLQEFASDERTLTDELCDMLCIWSQLFAHGPPMVTGSAQLTALPSVPFQFTLRKTTTSEEVKTGADLELVVGTPAGTKRSLIQAKVFDASKNSLRYDSKRDWHRLRKQLITARQQVGDLAMLLLYVPSSLLNREQHRFTTWEQGFVDATPTTHTNSRFGVTLVPANDLLTGNRWRSRGKLVHAGAARFKPAGMSLTRFLLELISCRRGVWQQPAKIAGLGVEREDGDVRPYRRLDIGVGEPDGLSFNRLAEVIRSFLAEVGSERVDV